MDQLSCPFMMAFCVGESSDPVATQRVLVNGVEVNRYSAAQRAQRAASEGFDGSKSEAAKVRMVVARFQTTPS